MDDTDIAVLSPRAETPRPTHLDRLLSQREVSIITSLSKRSIYRLIQAGQFPAPLRISPGRVAWTASSVAAWQQGAAA